VAKPYKVGVHAGMLTLTELVPESTLRAAPAEPPVGRRQEGQQAAPDVQAGGQRAGLARGGRAARDRPGPRGAAPGGQRAEAEGAETLKIERGERVTFEQRAAEADLAALLDADLLS
jgi:hypothetical protein